MGSEPDAICRWHSAGGRQREEVGKDNRGFLKGF